MNSFGMSDEEYERFRKLIQGQFFGSMFSSESSPASLPSSLSINWGAMAPMARQEPVAPPLMKFEPAYEPKWDAKVQTGALVAAGYRPFNVRGHRVWAKRQEDLLKRYGREGKPLPMNGIRIWRTDVVVLDEQDGGAEMITSVSEA